MSKKRPRTLRDSERRPGQAGDLRERPAARQMIAYTCHRGHQFEVTFAAEITPPAAWDCRCGRPASIGQKLPQGESELQRRMAQVRQRRGAPELEQLLADRIGHRRGTTT